MTPQEIKTAYAWLKAKGQPITHRCIRNAAKLLSNQKPTK